MFVYWSGENRGSKVKRQEKGDSRQGNSMIQGTESNLLSKDGLRTREK